MGLIIWGDAYEISVSEIDDQHKGLVEIINSLHEAISKGETNNVLTTIIPNLVKYTQVHFATEEKYMAKYHYPESGEHITEHQQFVEKVSQLVQELNSGEKILNISLFTFLKDWLLRHIAYTDKKLGIFLSSRLSTN